MYCDQETALSRVQCGFIEIAALYEVHPNQVSIWKKQFIESASSTFSKPDSHKDKQNAEDVDVLYRKIGRLEVENEFLKKSGISLMVIDHSSRDGRTRPPIAQPGAAVPLAGYLAQRALLLAEAQHQGRRVDY